MMTEDTKSTPNTSSILNTTPTITSRFCYKCGKETSHMVRRSTEKDKDNPKKLRLVSKSKCSQCKYETTMNIGGWGRGTG